MFDRWWVASFCNSFELLLRRTLQRSIILFSFLFLAAIATIKRRYAVHNTSLRTLPEIVF